MGKLTLLQKMRWDKLPDKRWVGLPDDAVDLLPDEPQSDYPVDLLIRSVFSLKEFKHTVLEVWEEKMLKPDGVLYVIYPKKGNKQYEEFIGRDDIFPALSVSEETGLVAGTQMKFNKLFAFNETFTCIGIKRMA